MPVARWWQGGSDLPARVAMARAGVLLFAALAHGVSGEATPSKCRELGFSDVVVCSRCDELAEFLPGDKLVDECRGCCIAAESVSISYSKIVLEVCQ